MGIELRFCGSASSLSQKKRGRIKGKMALKRF